MSSDSFPCCAQPAGKRRRLERTQRGQQAGRVVVHRQQGDGETRHPPPEPLRVEAFRGDDQLDRAIVDLLRIEQLHDLGILISELIVRNLRYVQNDPAFDRMTGPDLLENSAC
jgi:hypothetical protein